MLALRPALPASRDSGGGHRRDSGGRRSSATQVRIIAPHDAHVIATTSARAQHAARLARLCQAAHDHCPRNADTPDCRRPTVNSAVASSSRVLNRIDAQKRISMIYDPDKETAVHAQLSERTGTTVYLADPQSPWQCRLELYLQEILQLRILLPQKRCASTGCALILKPAWDSAGVSG